MIITRTPLRISLFGGGTDVSDFYKEETGCVVSFPINRYVYLSLNRSFENKGFFLKYSDIERCETIDDIRHRIIKSVFSEHEISGVEFLASADFPGGTGMGSSSAFTVGLHRLCSEYRGMSLSNFEYATLACRTEIEKLGEPIGKQDQFGCAIGGAKFIEFEPDGLVKVSPLDLTQNQENLLSKNLFLIRIPGTRSASKILSDQFSGISNNKSKKKNLRAMAEQARSFSRDIENNIPYIGEWLHDGWMVKKSLSPLISNDIVDAIYDRALKAGATGGKLLGAGGSGFLMMYCPREKHQEFARNMSDLSITKINLDFSGSVTIHKSLDRIFHSNDLCIDNGNR